MLVPIGLSLLKKITKYDLMIIILTREKCLYDKINEFNDSIKHNDKKIFKNQQKEIQRLREMLLKDLDFNNIINECVQNVRNEIISSNTITHPNLKTLTKDIVFELEHKLFKNE